MPSIPIFLADQDLDALSEMLGSDSEIAIISSESEAPKLKLWHAYDQLPLVSGKSYCLWHMPSGPVVVQGERKGDPDWIEVEDPFGGWLAYPYSNDWDGNPPIFNRRQKWSHAAMASFCRGVMPPMAVLGRSLL